MHVDHFRAVLVYRPEDGWQFRGLEFLLLQVEQSILLAEGQLHPLLVEHMMDDCRAEVIAPFFMVLLLLTKPNYTQIAYQSLQEAPLQELSVRGPLPDRELAIDLQQEGTG